MPRVRGVGRPGGAWVGAAAGGGWLGPWPEGGSLLRAGRCGPDRHAGEAGGITGGWPASAVGLPPRPRCGCSMARAMSWPRTRAWPAVESLAAVEAAALAGCPAGTRRAVVIEPAGPAWLPIAVFFTA